jgi:hypothetical protein
MYISAFLASSFIFVGGNGASLPVYLIRIRQVRAAYFF